VSKNTKHLSAKQRAALYCQAHCQREARNADRHWQRAAPFFHRMLAEGLYSELDFPNFSAWCESIGVSPGHGYALAQLDGLSDNVKISLHKENLSLSKIKLLLSSLDGLENGEAQELIERVAEIPTWHETRQFLHGNDPEPRAVIVTCPRCNRELLASRRVVLEVK
jgi:hypothetical protein